MKPQRVRGLRIFLAAFMGGLCAATVIARCQRSDVYIDGLNLYYGALRDSPYRWLDLMKLSRGLLKASDRVQRYSLLHRPG